MLSEKSQKPVSYQIDANKFPKEKKSTKGQSKKDRLAANWPKIEQDKAQVRSPNNENRKERDKKQKKYFISSLILKPLTCIYKDLQT